VNDTLVTVVGNVVDSPRRVRLENGAVTNFRMASTARRYDTRSQEFVDAGTFWVDVECWNDLSGNVSSSVSKGDPVVVHGALTTHSWESDTGRRSTPRIKAFAVGPNLARGSAEFRRTPRTNPAGTAAAEQPSVEPTPGDEQLARELENEYGRLDYEDASETLQEKDSEDSVREPALH
jgi:single-strand DNA-binding protein